MAAGGERWILWAAGGVLLLAGALVPASAQTLRYSNHREVEIPKYALVRIGPFYSTFELSQSAGVRWSRSRGSGVVYLTDNRLGEIREDGIEYPLITTLLFRNYLLLTRRADIDLSIAMTYAQYPMDTQDDRFDVFFPEEAILGNLSTEFQLTRVIKGTFFDNFIFKTDYVDTRGITDLQGGREYQYFNNVVGLNADWLMNRRMNLGLSLSREDRVPFDDEFEDQERVSYNESLIYEYEIMDGLVTGLGVSLAQHQYTLTNRVDSTEENVFLVLRFSKGLTGGFRLTRATSGLISIGYGRTYAAASSRVAGDVPGDLVAPQGSGSSWAEAITGEALITTELTKTLKHTLRYQRGLRRGFNSPAEQVDQFSYDLNWATANPNVKVYSQVQAVEPLASDESSYRNWASGVDVNFPLGRGANLLVGTRYDQRLNDVSGSESSELALESQDDYGTWTTFARLGVPLMKELSFDAEASHTERISDVAELDYTRDVLAANLVYRHQF